MQRDPVKMVGVLCMTAIGLCFLLATSVAFAQRVPDPGKPRMVAVPCPACKRWIDTPGGRMPTACPFCPFSFVQKANPTYTPLAPRKPQLQPINPFGDYLFFGVPIVPEDGKLVTRHLDPNGLAARAEEWGKQMRQIDQDAIRKREEEKLAFERRKGRAMQGLDSPGAPGRPQLRNHFGGDPSVPNSAGEKPRTPQLLRNPWQLDDLDAQGQKELHERRRIQQASDQSRYAHMRPEELDALAAQYPDNPEIQQAIAGLKSRVKSLDALAAASERTSEDRQAMEEERRKAHRESLRATSIVLDLTLNVPQGLDEVYYKEKGLANWLGVDAASHMIQDGVQDFAVEKAEGLAGKWKWKTPDAVTKLGGMGSVVDGITAIEDLIALARTANLAGNHYVAAAELQGRVQGAGGTTAAVGRWSYMRERTLDDSARLHRLIQEEEARRKR